MKQAKEQKQRSFFGYLTNQEGIRFIKGKKMNKSKNCIFDVAMHVDFHQHFIADVLEPKYCKAECN